MPEITVPLLLVNRDTGRGLRGVARIAHDPGRERLVLGGNLGPEACRAARLAFDAAANLFDGQARWRLDTHAITVTVHGHPDVPVLEGSIGLPLALAFAALWTGQTWSRDVVATGVLDVDALRPVLGLPAKLEAASGHHGTCVAPLPHGAKVKQAGFLQVASLAEAGERLGLLAPPFEPELGTRRQRERELRDLLDRVEHQDLAALGASGEPWLDVATTVRQLIRSLVPGDAQNRGLLLDARCYGALAFLHAGYPWPAGDLLGPEPDPHRRTHRLLWNIIRLGGEIDRETGGQDDRIQVIDELLTEPLEHDGLRGHAMGTCGRSLMHRQRPAAALPRLVAAAEAQQGSAPSEAGRSWNYVAAAQRLMGHLDDARETCLRAADLLRRHTRQDRPSYYRSTLMFLRYEQARIEVDAGCGGVPERLQEALRHVKRGLQLADELETGSWPRAGLLRTACWADPKHKDEYLERLQRLPSMGDDAFWAALVAEAEGPHRTDGLVY